MTPPLFRRRRDELSHTKFEPIWDELFPAEQQRVVGLLIDKVVVNTDGLDINIHAQGLRSLVTELIDTSNAEDERTRNR